jgi:hypothetical protein
MGKAGTKPPRKTKTKLTDKEQSERFKEAARIAEADETGDTFERVFRKLVPPKTQQK